MATNSEAPPHSGTISPVGSSAEAPSQDTALLFAIKANNRWIGLRAPDAYTYRLWCTQLSQCAEASRGESAQGDREEKKEEGTDKEGTEFVMVADAAGNEPSAAAMTMRRRMTFLDTRAARRSVTRRHSIAAGQAVREIARRSSLEPSTPDARGGHAGAGEEGAEWEADEARGACAVCEEVFSVVRRRHHCRYAVFPPLKVYT